MSWVRRERRNARCGNRRQDSRRRGIISEACHRSTSCVPVTRLSPMPNSAGSLHRTTTARKRTRSHETSSHRAAVRTCGRSVRRNRCEPCRVRDLSRDADPRISVRDDAPRRRRRHGHRGVVLRASKRNHDRDPRARRERHARLALAPRGLRRVTAGAVRGRRARDSQLRAPRVPNHYHFVSSRLPVNAPNRAVARHSQEQSWSRGGDRARARTRARALGKRRGRAMDGRSCGCVGLREEDAA